MYCKEENQKHLSNISVELQFHRNNPILGRNITHLTSTFLCLRRESTTSVMGHKNCNGFTLNADIIELFANQLIES